MFGTRKEETPVLTRNLFIPVPETRAGKIQVVIKACIDLDMPIPQEYVDAWNKVAGTGT